MCVCVCAAPNFILLRLYTRQILHCLYTQRKIRFIYRSGCKLVLCSFELCVFCFICISVFVSNDEIKIFSQSIKLFFVSIDPTRKRVLGMIQILSKFILHLHYNRWSDQVTRVLLTYHKFLQDFYFELIDQVNWMARLSTTLQSQGNWLGSSWYAFKYDVFIRYGTVIIGCQITRLWVVTPLHGKIHANYIYTVHCRYVQVFFL